ncbi:MAG TPA: hypothetical protein VM099_03850 [Gemmatimonadaceae bacterium]|nr:hypothetical protein [Gemmatimonadaceae bacterium]
MSRQSADIIFWIAVVACIIAQLGVFRAEFFRPRKMESSQSELRHSSRVTEILFAVIPAIGLAGILTATWFALH